MERSAPAQVCRGALRLAYVLANNLYCIPSYFVWMLLLFPLCLHRPELYWRIEGRLYHWLQCVVGGWCWTAGYNVVEMGQDMSSCLDDETLVIVNHQSTGDVPLLMSVFETRANILPNLMWVMDRMFKFTNFGLVSVMHGDFFISSGRDKRESSVEDLRRHLRKCYLPLRRKWILLFPEGGLLVKRRESSQRFAKKNGLPVLQHVTLPRVGAMMGIVQELHASPNAVANHPGCLKWVLDVTVAYPEGKPLSLDAVVFALESPREIVMYYRVYSFSEVPSDQEGMTRWLYERFVEKEGMLETFYKTGCFQGDPKVKEALPRRNVDHDWLRHGFLHLFFIVSTLLHIRMFKYVFSTVWA